MEDLDFQTEIKLLNGLYSTTHTAPLLAVCKIKAEPILYKVHPGGYFFRDTISLDEIDTLSCAKMARFQPRWVSSTPFWYSLLSTWFHSVNQLQITSPEGFHHHFKICLLCLLHKT